MEEMKSTNHTVPKLRRKGVPNSLASKTLADPPPHPAAGVHGRKQSALPFLWVALSSHSHAARGYSWALGKGLMMV